MTRAARTAARDIFDAIVIGAGPAGSTVAARLARTCRRVLVVEATDMAQQGIGEFLSPQARAALHRSALLDPDWEVPHRVVHAFGTSWGTPQVHSRDYIYDARGHAMLLNRGVFNRQLAAAALKQGAQWLTSSHARQAQFAHGLWTLHIDCHPPHQRRPQLRVRAPAPLWVRARFLIDCSGRVGAPIPGIPARRRRLDRMICLGARIRGVRDDPMPAIEAYSRGWAYSAGLDGELIVNICTEPHQRLPHCERGTAALFLRELSECPMAASRVQMANPRGASEVALFATDASSALTRPAVGPGWCLAGDRAQSMDPLSSGGIEGALRHAKLIADAVDRATSLTQIDLTDYAAALDASYGNYLDTRRRFYALEPRWSGAFWQSRRGSMRAV